MLKKYTIPTILGLVVLLGGTFAGIFLIRQGPTFFLKATPAITPNQVKVTNITDTSFTVSWMTDDKTSGFILFGETPSLGNVAADERDAIAGTTGSFPTHYVTLKNLQPKTKYYFKISSGGKTFDQAGKPWEVTIAATPTSPAPPSDIASGKVLNEDQTPADGAILYLSLANMTPQSVLIRSSGNWLIALNNAFSSDLSGYASYDREAQVVEIFVQGAQKTATAVTTTKNDNPVPPITLGQTYDFRKEIEKEPLGPIITEEDTDEPEPVTEIDETSSKFSFEDLEEETSQTSLLSISNPEEEEVVNTQKPAFSGKGPAGETIKIVIESSTTHSENLLVDDQGNWAWTPPEDLEPGEHTVTISYQDRTVTRRFTILAAGESTLPSFTATPSATTPTPTPTPTPTATPTPTLAPEDTRTALPSTEAGVPAAGHLTPTFWLFIMGVVLMLIGIITQTVSVHARKQ